MTIHDLDLQSSKRNARAEASALLGNFLHRLAHVKVLDPACGSGNFLYVTLQKLLDLEKEVNDYALRQNLTSYTPHVSPEQLYGIEINPYAFHLAQMTIWIGYLQWRREHGYLPDYEPILRPMEDNFWCMDAILERPLADARGSDALRVLSPKRPTIPSRERQRAGVPREPDWHTVDFIVGNPPFLGGKRLRNVAFMGDTKGGAFDITEDVALEMLHAPNPHGRPNSDVIVPWVNGLDVTRRSRGMFIIDFGTQMTEAEAARYEAPFEYVLKNVRPIREQSRTTTRSWWLHERPRAEMRSAISALPRFLCTARVTKYR